MEPDTKSQHVVPQGNGWAVKAQNSEKASKTFELKMNAIMHAFKIAKTRGEGKVIIHKKNGTIQNVNVTDYTNALMAILKS